MNRNSSHPPVSEGVWACCLNLAGRSGLARHAEMLVRLWILAWTILMQSAAGWTSIKIAKWISLTPLLYGLL